MDIYRFFDSLINDGLILRHLKWNFPSKYYVQLQELPYELEH